MRILSYAITFLLGVICATVIFITVGFNFKVEVMATNTVVTACVEGAEVVEYDLQCPLNYTLSDLLQVTKIQEGNCPPVEQCVPVEDSTVPFYSDEYK